MELNEFFREKAIIFEDYYSANITAEQAVEKINDNIKNTNSPFKLIPITLKDIKQHKTDVVELNRQDEVEEDDY